MKTVSQECLHCKKNFEAPLKEVNRGNGRFCSIDCGNAHKRGVRRKPDNCSCAVCQKTFRRPPNKLKLSKSGLYFCSRKCKDLANTIGNPYSLEEIWPDHFGTRSSDKSIYRKICFSKYEKKCYQCGYDKIPEVIQVHHIDRNRENNDISNLIPLCPTCHEENHFLAKDGKWKCSKNMVEVVGSAPTPQLCKSRVPTYGHLTPN